MIATDGRYVAIQQPNGVEVLDEQTGRSRLVSTAGQSGSCRGFSLEGPWLVYDCINPDGTHDVSLYSLASGTWRQVSIGADCVDSGGSGFSGASTCDIGPVGADWLAWTEQCWNCGSYGGLIPLSTRDARLSAQPPASPTTMLDFNAPTLLSRVCAPLRNLPTNRLLIDPWGRFYSGAISDDAPLGTHALAVDGSKVYLERCGSRARQRLHGFPVGNASSLIFYPGVGGNVTGLFLTTGQRFVIHLPSRVLAPPPNSPTAKGVGEVLLTTRNLYLFDQEGRLWRAPAPRPPRSTRGSS